MKVVVVMAVVVVMVVVVMVIITLSFMDTRWHSGLLDARLFRASDCDSNHFRVRVRINVFP
jgi:hypothetical protein